MTDGAAEPTADGQPTVEHAALAADAGANGQPVPTLPTAPAPLAPTTASGGAPDERPELAVGAAFAGGIVLALILKRLAR
jgi:hypothetical protein